MNKSVKLKPSVNAGQIELSSPVLALRKVSANTHVAFDGSYYSVPHVLFGNTVIVRATNSYISVLDCNGDCVASHLRSFVKGKYSTDPSHLPDFYYSILWGDRFDAAKIREWANRIGDNTSLLIDTLLEMKPFEEQAYKHCVTVLLIAKKYGALLLERACKLAIANKTYNFAAIQKLALAEHEKNFKS